MFGAVVAMLERKGALDNAIVVVLSDHGEALALPERHDAQQRVEDSKVCARRWW